MATKFCLVCSLRLHWLWEGHLRPLNYKCLNMNILVKNMNIQIIHYNSWLHTTDTQNSNTISFEVIFFFMNIDTDHLWAKKKTPSTFQTCPVSQLNFQLWVTFSSYYWHQSSSYLSNSFTLYSFNKSSRNPKDQNPEDNRAKHTSDILAVLKYFTMLWFHLKSYVAYFDHVFWSEFKQAAPVGGKASLHFLSRHKKRFWTGTNMKNVTKWNNIRWKPIWAGWP